MREPLKKIAFTTIFLFLGLAFFGRIAYANNLSISNVTMTSPNSTNGTIQVQFDISWENSWRNSINRDAVWVFVKYSTDAGSSWAHATLKTAGTNPSDTSAGTGTALDIIIPSGKTGAFLERSATGFGNVSTTSVQLAWDYSTNGLSATSIARVKVFGVEMVYIPTASFYLGDGNGTTESTYAFHFSGVDNTAKQLTSSGTILVTDPNGNDDIDTGDTPGGVSIGANSGNGANDGSTDNTLWPTGYQSFYLMKYEITEGQWVNFFNTLTSAQKTTRDITAASGKNSDSTVERNTISWSSGSATTLRTDRACSYLSWMDLCAYADWAALRPITETEYEKAARGPNPAVQGEYAWGTTTITAVSSIGVSSTYTKEDGTEYCATSGGNCNYNSTSLSGGDTSGKGAVRAGFFADGQTGRQDSGAGYYGNMELSGNLIERTVTIGNATGRLFTASHGDGVLTTTASYEGNATNTDWPGIDGTSARGVTGATGSGSKGGGYDTANTYCRVSDRTSASVTSTARTNDNGGRAGRTAP